MWSETEQQAAPTRRLVAGTAVLGLALVLVLCVTRLAGLGDRLPHHDEMVHVFFAERLAFDGTYKADPMFHGPLLYHLEAGALRLLGRGLWQGRLVPALAGIAAALLLVGLAWRERGRAGAVGVAALVTLSPAWLYYSRFDAHDTLIVLMTALVAWGRWHWDAGHTRRATWLIVIALALAWSTKLNALFIVGAIGLWPVVRYVADGRAAAIPAIKWPPWTTVAAALGVALLVTGALFATTYVSYRGEAEPLRALRATLKAALVHPVTYWTGMHQTQRLGGPFHYYAVLLALYEPLLVLGSLLALLDAWRRRTHPLRLAIAVLTAGVLLAAASWPLLDSLRQWLHVYPPHLVVLPLFGVAVWTLLRDRGRAGDTAGVWWTWMAATQSLLYSYAGEKVPWLSVHVALPWFMLAGPAIARWWQAGAPGGRRLAARAVMVACGLLTARGAVAVATSHGSDVGEPMVQVEYDQEAHASFRRVSAVCPAITLDGGACVATVTDAHWFVEWYLRDMTHPVAIDALDAAGPTTPFVYAPARSGGLDAARRAAFTSTHVVEAGRFAATGTWVEWTGRPHPAALLRFWWSRRSLGPRRGVPYELWIRRDLLPAWHASGQDTQQADGRRNQP